MRQDLERRNSEELRTAYEQLRETTHGALLALSEAVEAKDDYTGGHVRRVRDLAVGAGRALAWRRDPLDPYAFRVQPPPGLARWRSTSTICRR